MYGAAQRPTETGLKCLGGKTTELADQIVYVTKMDSFMIYIVNTHRESQKYFFLVRMVEPNVNMFIRHIGKHLNSSASFYALFLAFEGRIILFSFFQTGYKWTFRISSLDNPEARRLGSGWG